MPAKLTPERVQFLAELAGFDFTPERCEKLANHLEELLGDLARLQELDLQGYETPQGPFPTGEVKSDD